MSLLECIEVVLELIYVSDVDFRHAKFKGSHFGYRGYRQSGEEPDLSHWPSTASWRMIR